MSTSAKSVARVISEPLAEPSHAAGVLLRELGRRDCRVCDDNVEGGSRRRRALGGRLACDPEDHDAGDQEQEPGAAVQRQADAREQDGSCDREESEPDQRPGAVSPVAEGSRRERVVLALVGHDERSGCVEEDARAAEEGEDDEADTEDGGMDLEVLGKAATDTGDLAIRAAALQAADLWDMCG